MVADGDIFEIGNHGREELQARDLGNASLFFHFPLQGFLHGMALLYTAAGNVPVAGLVFQVPVSGIQQQYFVFIIGNESLYPHLEQFFLSHINPLFHSFYTLPNRSLYCIIYLMSNSQAGERIADVFADWLNKEVRSSHTEVNAYLDDYSVAVSGLRESQTNNFLAQKHNSHVNNRLPQALETFKMSLEPGTPAEQADNQSAWLMFTPLMQVSGTYRGQCYIEATDGFDYMARRQSRPTAIDLEKVADRRLRVWLPDSDNFGLASISVEQLERRVSVATRIGGNAIAEVCMRAEQERDFGIENSVSAQVLKSAQMEWASFATDCLILAAKLRGGELEAVPFLEPKSISSTPPPEVFYPLAA